MNKTDLEIKLSNITIHAEEYFNNSSSDNFIFFLHGFTGSSQDWNEIVPLLNKRFNIIAIDLIGHGKSSSPGDTNLYTAESITEQIREVILHYTNEPVIIAGYSMGGRAALSFASRYPEMLRGLILESTSAGINYPDLRKDRAEQDEKLAEFIETHSMEEFVDYWMNISLFESQKKLPAKKLTTVRKSKLKNSRTGLANSLRGFSTGKMPALNNDIHSINITTLLISGSLDSKYTGINTELFKSFPSATHIIIENAGHNVHLERPSLFIDVINDFLNKF
ncbi:MAG: 2-succinyl-6-hydroxy-2,4-cyclohexadiene-1-carboxylate synthase [Ignavibacteriaceae bacterium]|nr:2-succinyl-6-hydroxy-2,4-cyclohexadiene-1-carboxylate synthase [Ignavibacteriaceae bacterium]